MPLDTGRTWLRTPLVFALLSTVTMPLAAQTTSPASAQDAASQPDRNGDQDRKGGRDDRGAGAETASHSDIVVTARQASASILGSDTALQLYPQSIRIFDGQALDALNATRMNDVLDLAGGVTRQNDFGGLWDKYAIRGFAGDENAGPDILINRFGSNLGYNAPIDSATIERVEVLKGASAALSGRGEPGGSINIVTKAPLDHVQAETQFSLGSFNRVRATADVTGPITNTLAARLIGVAERHDSFRDYVDGERVLIAPSLSWTPSPTVRALYQAQYMRNDNVLDRGVVGVNGDARALDRSTFLGEPADGAITQKIFWQQGSLFADLGGGIGLEVGGSHRDGSLRGLGTMVDFGGRGVQPGGQVAGRDRRRHNFAWNDLSLRAELTATPYWLGIEHDLRIGVDRVRHALDFRLGRARGTPANPILLIDLFDPVYGQPLPEPPIALSRTASFRSESVYAQDVIRAGAFTLLLGARWNSFREDVDNRLTGNDALDTRDSGVTPRAALSWRASEHLTLYTSWGRSLRQNPSDGFATFSAERSRSAEVGLKFTLLDGALTGQGALFDMEKRNVLNPNAADPFVKTQIGRQRSRGAEVSATWSMPGSVYATGTYTYIDAEIRNDANAALIGSPLSNVPAHAGSLFVLKQLGPWGIGGGVTYVGSRAGDPFGTDYRLPAYTVARANLSYDIAPEVTIRADLDNLFDTYYISSSYANVWTTPGAPRNFRITLSTRFP